jgi:8-oxo-dGTP pyrophosphatase MutT (NUDIX family)
MTVLYPENAPAELLEKSLLVPLWRESIDPGVMIESGEVKGMDLFPGPRIGFMEMDVRYQVSGNSHSERVILSGCSVSMVVLVRCIDDPVLYTIIVRQPRIGRGIISYEFPAGFVDDSRDFREAAVRELQEECGVSVSPDELIDLGELLTGEGHQLLPFPEVFGEKTSAYLLILTKTREEIAAMDGQLGGVDDEEQIFLQLIPFNDVLRLSSDAMTLAITYMVNRLIRESKIQIP